MLGDADVPSAFLGESARFWPHLAANASAIPIRVGYGFAVAPPGYARGFTPGYGRCAFHALRSARGFTPGWDIAPRWGAGGRRPAGASSRERPGFHPGLGHSAPLGRWWLRPAGAEWVSINNDENRPRMRPNGRIVDGKRPYAPMAHRPIRGRIGFADSPRP